MYRLPNNIKTANELDSDATRPRRRGDRIMATPVVPSQFAVGKNRIIHKPTTATFSFETGHTTFKSINWGRADEQLSSGLDYRKDDIIRVAQQLLSRLPR
jgi:hypothetical protein